MPEMMWDLLALSRSRTCSVEHACLSLVLQRQELKGQQAICSLLQSSKSLLDTLLAHRCGSVPLECRQTTLEQVERIAPWVAKYGPLLASVEIDTHSARPYLDPTNRAAALAALGSALQQAAASLQGLHLRSCKLAQVDWDCASILQQPPVNRLTSLELELCFQSRYDWDGCVERLAGVMTALSQLQQLRKLVLDEVEESSMSNELDGARGDRYLKYADPLLQSLSGLTHLTRLEVGTMRSLSALKHAPASLLELHYGWEPYEAPMCDEDLSHLTALTKLTTGCTAEIFSSKNLPVSLKELQCGRMLCRNALQPLRFLQRLDILSCRSTAAELARLSSLTQLTHIGLNYVNFDSANREYYWGYAEDAELTPDAASPAWPALASQLRALHISDFAGTGCETDDDLFQLSEAAVAALGGLSVMTSLTLEYLQCPEVQPQQLAAALQRCTALQELKLGDLELQWDPEVGLTGDENADALLLAAVKARGVEVLAGAIASLPGLQKLHISSLPVSMQAAAKLAAAAAGTQLTALELERNDLTDCGMSAIALGLTNLRSLRLHDAKVGDASLPALARLPLRWFDFKDCYFTTAAAELFIPHLLAERHRL